MTRPDIAISGAGPNGLMLACELALAGVSSVVLEQHQQRLDVQKANGLIGQVVRFLDHRGLFQRYRGDETAPQPAPHYLFAGFGLPVHQLDDNPMYALIAPQREWEALLEQRALELGVEIRRGHRLTRFNQDDHEVICEVAATDGSYQLHSDFLVGCDGGKSLVRREAGIDFPGTRSDLVSRIAHVSLPAELLNAEGLNVPGYGMLRPGHNHTSNGVCTFANLGPQGPMIGTLEWGKPKDVDAGSPVTLDEISASVSRVLQAEILIGAPRTPGPHYLRRNVGMNTRVANRYRNRRVFLVGDSAHVHSAIGGPGLNLGTQDAVNLGWKLAAAVNGWAQPGLLDSYEAERHPVAKRVKMHSLAQLALLAPNEETVALRQLFGELLTSRENRARIAGLVSGSDIVYEMGEADHELVGRFVPDFVVSTSTATHRIAELMRSGRPLLLDLSQDAAPAEMAAAWSDRVDALRVNALSPPARALLIRPDGYVAWATDGSIAPHNHTGLDQALTTWFGPAVHTTRAH